MHVIKPYETSATLFGADGSVRVFKSLAAAWKALGRRFIEHEVAKNFTEYLDERVVAGGGIAHVYKRASYVMRDDMGQPLTREDFARFYPYYQSCWGIYPYYCGYGPVPNVRKSRGGGGYFRRMKTMAARRQAQHVSDDEPRVRAARSANVLPNSWDDYRNSSRDNDNWKRYRKTQYKVARE